MIDLTVTLIAFARARAADSSFDDSNVRYWASQNVDALDLCVILAEAKAHAEETEDAELEAALEGVAEIFISF